MEPRPEVTKAILEVVDNQLRSGDPPETKTTYDRLLDLGYSRSETRKLLSYALLTEMNQMIKEMKPFNRKRFSKRLRRLPELT